MNKKLLALAVAAAAVATGANANELYNKDGNSLTMGGRAEARLAMSDGDATDNSRVRLNFLGKTMITDSLYGVGFYEGEFRTDDYGIGSEVENRYTYAGIGGNFGEVTYGKNDGALGVITDFTDIMAYHGNEAAYKIDAADRVDNTIAYKAEFSDLAVKASYRFEDADQNNDGFSVSAIYAFGDSGFKLGAGYADQGDENEAMVAASFAIADFYFAGNFVTGEKEYTAGGITDISDATGFEVAASYTLDKLVFTTTYNNLDLDETSDTDVDQFAIDATYYFKPNFRTYASYMLNLVDDEEDEIVLGMRYDF